MKIIILGAGQVGSSTAESLANEGNDITIIDQNPILLERLQEHLDIRTVVGFAAYPETLLKAGIEDADMLIAVTHNDEVNMVACQIASSLFNTPKKLARVRATDYLEYPALFNLDAIPIDVSISPEQLVTEYIADLIEQPDTLQVLNFFEGLAQLVAVKIDHGSDMDGRSIEDLLALLPKVQMRVAAIFRNEQLIKPNGGASLQADDELFFLAKKQQVRDLVKVFKKDYQPYQRLVIAGGGHIGKQLAQRLEQDHHIKIIEHDESRARTLAGELHSSLVLHGDVGDANLLKEEQINKTDVFCAVTNDDEANILSAMLAKRLGVRKAFSIISKASHVDLVEGTSIDIAVSPAQITIGTLLRHVRRGDVVTVHSLRQGAAEAIEIVAHGDKQTSQVVGRTLDELRLPASATVGALLRDGQILFAHKEIQIQSEDHLVIFIANQQDVDAVEKLFQVGFEFL
ncbi:Trk system potassium transporter TrkA [Methylophaga lonarensis]|uniref:Trk system potassium transporter TrkA n=1 Tax=Methylophaga lonarensis TaxID=999151 RepID=UPI003D29FFBC